MDKITQRLFGLAAVIAAFAFLIQTTTPAVADSPTTTYSNGRYMMSMQAVPGQEHKMNWYVLAWDTDTGRSKFYYGNAKEGMVAAASRFNLPSNPL